MVQVESVEPISHSRSGPPDQTPPVGRGGTTPTSVSRHPDPASCVSSVRDFERKGEKEELMRTGSARGKQIDPILQTAFSRNI